MLLCSSRLPQFVSNGEFDGRRGDKGGRHEFEVLLSLLFAPLSSQDPFLALPLVLLPAVCFVLPWKGLVYRPADPIRSLASSNNKNPFMVKE